MEKIINYTDKPEVQEAQEVADKQVKLRPSQKALLESKKLTSKESLADVFDRVILENIELKKKIEKQFNISAIQKHNESIKSHMQRIIEINADIERQAKDMIELEMKKYTKSIEDVQEVCVMLADTMEELETIKGENKTLIEESKKLEKELEEQKNENSELKEANKNLESAKEDYKNKFEETNTNINILREENINIKSQLNDKNNHITTLENDIKNLNVTIATKDIKIDNLELLIGNLNKDKEYLQNSLNTANDTIEKKDERISAITEHQQVLIGSVTKLEEELRESGKKYSRLETTYETEKKENEHKMRDLEREKSELEKDIKAKDTQIEGLNDDLSSKETEIGDLEQDIISKNTKIDELNDDITDKVNEIGSLKQDIKNKDAKISEVTKENSELKIRLKNASGEC